MVFWSRLRHLKFECLSQKFKTRGYYQIHRVSSAHDVTGRTNIIVFPEPNLLGSRRPTDPYNFVRSFAAPVQVKPKPEAKDTSGTRINNQITAEYVRVVYDEGHTIVSRREALERAKKLNLDLVEVDRMAKPPVCKIMDFHREKYIKQTKEKDRTKSKSEVSLRKGDCKEVRFTGKIEQKDLQMKADMAKRLMEKGYRVKCMAMGTEDQDLGGFLGRFSALIEDIAFVESGPRVEKKQAFVIVRHVKFGAPKSGPSKKVAKVADSTKTDVRNAPTRSATINTSNHIQTPQQIDEDLEQTESGSEFEEDEIIPDQIESPILSSMKTTDEKLKERKMEWSAFDDRSDDFEKVFDVDSSNVGENRSSADEPINSASTLPFGCPPQDVSSIQAHVVSTPFVKPSFEVENRYNSRNEPRIGFPPAKSSTGSTPNDPNLFAEIPKFSPSVQQKHDINRIPPRPMDSRRVDEPQFLNQQRPLPPPLSMRRAPPLTEQKQNLENNASMFRSSKQPTPGVVNDAEKQKVPSPQGFPNIRSPNPTPSYGIFSTPNLGNPPNKQNPATEVTKEVNSLKQKAESTQRAEADKTSEKKWGIFSGK